MQGPSWPSHRCCSLPVRSSWMAHWSMSLSAASRHPRFGGACCWNSRSAWRCSRRRSSVGCCSTPGAGSRRHKLRTGSLRRRLPAGTWASAWTPCDVPISPRTRRGCRPRCGRGRTNWPRLEACCPRRPRACCSALLARGRGSILGPVFAHWIVDALDGCGD